MSLKFRQKFSEFDITKPFSLLNFFITPGFSYLFSFVPADPRTLTCTCVATLPFMDAPPYCFQYRMSLPVFMLIDNFNPCGLEYVTRSSNACQYCFTSKSPELLLLLVTNGRNGFR